MDFYSSKIALVFVRTNASITFIVDINSGRRHLLQLLHWMICVNFFSNLFLDRGITCSANPWFCERNRLNLSECMPILFDKYLRLSYVYFWNQYIDVIWFIFYLIVAKIFNNLIWPTYNLLFLSINIFICKVRILSLV